MHKHTEIIRVGYKIYIITKATDKTFVTTIGLGTKIETRVYKSELDMPSKERLKIRIARIFQGKHFKSGNR